MTDDHLSRRTLLRSAAVVLGASGLASRTTPASAADLVVHPRDDWGKGLPAVGRLEQEAPSDVRFLLVHHTASPNGYPAEQVPRLLQSFFRYHTGTKGWPDVAYNFFVDAHGGVWEGRTGSLGGPVRGSATGGSQGFALLCCYVGDLNERPPTPAAERSMVRLLARLADEYDVDTAPGSTATFTSRGSNKHPRGTRVTCSTISGHRDMSLTTCPGDKVYRRIVDDYPELVTAQRAGGAVRVPAPASVPPEPSRRPTTTPPPRTPAAPAPAPAPAKRSQRPERTRDATPKPSTPATSTAAPLAAPVATSDDGVSPLWPVAGVAGLGAVGAAAALAARGRGD